MWDGVFIATRRIGDRVHVVSRHSPYVPRDSGGGIASMTLDELLPKVTVAGVTRLLMAPSDCYITMTQTPKATSGADHRHFVLDAKSGCPGEHLL